MSVTLSKDGDDVVVHSFGRGDDLQCKDYVREKLGIRREFKKGAPRKTFKSASLVPFIPKDAPKPASWVSPVPDDAPLAPDYGQSTAATFCDAEGRPSFAELRFDHKDGSKHFNPLTLWRLDDGGALEWRLKAPPAPRTLYNLDLITSRPEAVIIQCEGPKCCDAASIIHPEMVATTSLNGAQSSKQNDWTPLTGRTVIQWQDLDEAGQIYVDEVAAILATMPGTTVLRVDAYTLAQVDPLTGGTREPPPKFDAAFAIGKGKGEDGWEIEALRLAALGLVQPVDLATAAKSKPKAQGNGAGNSETKGEIIMVAGIKKRVTDFADLDRRFAILQVFGLPSVYISRPDFIPIQDIDLKRRLDGEVVQTGIDRDGNPIYTSAFKFWTGNAHRHAYRTIEFTSERRPDSVYNFYRGLGVTPEPGCCQKILAHIKEVICSNDEVAYEAMLNLMAWQIQHIGEPSRIIVVLHNPNQQAGKGIVLEEILLKIYGPSGFSPSSMDQILGRFNDSLRGRAFVFCDEVLFSGDLRAANALKALSTTTLKGLETKGLPIIQCPVAVNLWLVSNDETPIHLEEGDARHWILRVNEKRIGDVAYFEALADEIITGGREAFADFLLNRNVKAFVPKRDVPRDNSERRDMILRCLNPYDARAWLWDCATAEKILGMNFTEYGNVSTRGWQEQAIHSFGDLLAAYTAWQGTVRTRVAPRPTPSGNFGEVLGKAGFTIERTSSTRNRALPSADACLKALADAEKWKK
jgi:Family of unknown function (DUF5906)